METTSVSIWSQSQAFVKIFGPKREELEHFLNIRWKHFPKTA